MKTLVQGVLLATVLAIPVSGFAASGSLMDPVITTVKAKTACNGGTTVSSDGDTLSCPSDSGVKCDTDKESCTCLRARVSIGGDEQEVAINYCINKPDQG